MKQFDPDFIQSPPSPHLPTLPLPSTAPLVPSTPLPDGIISDSPAWQPGSRTPGRPLEEPRPPQHRIPKPAGRVNRKNGYSLKESMELEERVYLEIKVSQMNLVIRFLLRTIQKDIETLATQHFDISLPYSKQSEQSRSTVLEEVCGFTLTFEKKINDVRNRQQDFIRNYIITSTTGLSRTSLPYS
jgi:hypothetical protein